MTRAAVAELWERIEPILDAALEMPAESWPGFLDNACGSDMRLRAAVERLLESTGNTTTPGDGEIGAVAWAQPILLERELAAPSRLKRIDPALFSPRGDGSRRDQHAMETPSSRPVCRR